MAAYVLRRCLQVLPVVFGVVTLVFFLLRLTPGDPALVLAGPDAPPHVVAELRSRMGLDRPLLSQYVIYLGHLLRGDLGVSIHSRQPVLQELAEAFPYTLELVMVATLWSVLLSLPIGIVSAIKRNSWVDRVAMLFAVSGVSLPIFVISLFTIYVFSFKLGWFPTSGRGGPVWTLEGLRHIVLPGVALGTYHVASLARIVRSSMLETLHQDFIRVARAKGLGEAAVILKHALRNSLLSVITVLGYDFAFMLGGTVVAESIFAWPGVGRMIWDAIMTSDYPIIQGALLVLALSFSLINLLVDILYAVIDPRISYD